MSSAKADDPVAAALAKFNAAESKHPEVLAQIDAIFFKSCRGGDDRDPAGIEDDDIVGDIGVAPNVLANWGLHLIDVNLVMGNLLDIVSQQTKAYLKKT